MLVDRHVAAVGLHPRGVQTEQFAVWNRSDGHQRMRTTHDAAVVAFHHHRVAFPRHGSGPGAFQQLDAPGEEIHFKRCGDLGILLRKHLLPAHHESYLAAHGLEHVNELDTGDAGADHHDVFRQLRRRVTVARQQNPVAIDICPFRHPRPAPGGQNNRVGLDLTMTLI